jgi:hypothetical protein
MIDSVSTTTIAICICIEMVVSGSHNLALSYSVLAVCFIDSMYTLKTGELTVLAALRVYFLIIYNDATKSATLSSIDSFYKMLGILAIPAVSVVFFSCLSVILFGGDDEQFKNLANAVVSMYSMLTTSNNPDVWLHLYDIFRPNSLFFVTYILIVLFFVQSYVVAVIYSTFLKSLQSNIRIREERRNRCLRLAFSSLDVHNESLVHRDDVIKVLCAMRPHYSEAKIAIMYDVIDPNRIQKKLNIDEFSRIIDSLHIQVRRSSQNGNEYSFERHINLAQMSVSSVYVLISCCYGHSVMNDEFRPLNELMGTCLIVLKVVMTIFRVKRSGLLKFILRCLWFWSSVLQVTILAVI